MTTELLKRPQFVESKVRATLHVPDPLISGYLVQLLDYQPRKEPANRGTAGRALSQRFGTIGVAWRANQDQVEEGKDAASLPKERVDKWAMTRQEATRQQRLSYYAFVIREDEDEASDKLGIFYMDAEVPGFFDSAVVTPLVQRHVGPLREALRAYEVEVLAPSPRIEI